MKSAEINATSVHNKLRLFRKMRPNRRAKNDSFLSFDDEERFNSELSSKQKYFNFKVRRWTKDCYKEITDKL